MVVWMYTACQTMQGEGIQSTDKYKVQNDVDNVHTHSTDRYKPTYLVPL